MELSELVNIVKFIEHLLSFDFDIVEGKSCIVDSVKTNFYTHIFDENARHRFHLIVSDLD